MLYSIFIKKRINYVSILEYIIVNKYFQNLKLSTLEFFKKI